MLRPRNRPAGRGPIRKLLEMDRLPHIPGFDAERCADYLEGTRSSPPRAQLTRSLKHASMARGAHALDIGCGPGKEVVELLRAGFSVTAIDPYPSMIQSTLERVKAECPLGLARLQLICSRFEDHGELLQPRAFAVVHAGFVLPFVQSHDFDRSFDAIRRSLAVGGVFVGQLFGPNDEFVRASPPGTMSCHDAAAVKALLRGLEVLEHEEVNRSGFIGAGKPKWWHVHHIVARKSPEPQA